VYKFLIGILAGVVLANAWHARHEVLVKRQEMLLVEVSPTEEEKVDPRKIFKKGMMYVIVRIDDDPKVAVVKAKMSTHESELFFSDEEAILGIEPGVAFYLDHVTGDFVILDPSRI
jgi:hypothetical protein